MYIHIYIFVHIKNSKIVLLKNALGYIVVTSIQKITLLYLVEKTVRFLCIF